jgi:molybdate transport system substrate-binding protein
VLALLAFTCAAPAQAADTRLTVFAASSLQEALRDLGRAYRTRHPETRIEFSFAGTLALRAQIEHGAPADLFVSADTLHAGALHRARRVHAPVVFAKNRLALVTRGGWIVTPGALDIAMTLRGGLSGAPEAGDRPTGTAGALPDRSNLGPARTVMQSLLREGTRIVLADSTVPAGRYAREALERMSRDPVLGAAFRRRVEARVVSHEANVRAVLAKVVLGEADAGFVYETDLRTVGGKVGHAAIPDPWNVEALYAVAVVGTSKQTEAAESFAAFLTGDFARSILRRHGFSW